MYESTQPRNKWRKADYSRGTSGRAYSIRIGRMTEEEKAIFSSAVNYAKSTTCLAKSLGVSPQTVKKWRLNIARPRQEYIDAMLLFISEQLNG